VTIESGVLRGGTVHCLPPATTLRSQIETLSKVVSDAALRPK
jgi:hypothetical protein